MILGIGIDIVSVDRVQYITAEHGERFQGRILTMVEQSHLPQVNTAEYMAGRFAAKEAVIKALGVKHIGLNDIEILNDDNGKPFISNCSNLSQKAGLADVTLHISISHERDYAVGMAILESISEKRGQSPGESGKN